MPETPHPVLILKLSHIVKKNLKLNSKLNDESNSILKQGGGGEIQVNFGPGWSGGGDENSGSIQCYNGGTRKKLLSGSP